MQGFLLKVYKKTWITWVHDTVIFIHGDNIFDASYSAPLSFRVELGVDRRSRDAFLTIVNNLFGNKDPVSSAD